MKGGFVHRERGAALLALLAVIMLGASWFLVSRLNADSNLLTAVNRQRNAEVLNKAKRALIGYVAAQAAVQYENRPGALPCPEAPADFNDPLANGSDGTVSYPCTLPIVGRFPWRTLGLDKLVDAAGEPLWYAIASGWAGASTVINSNCAYYNAAGLACQSGRLSVDGVAVASSDVIAVIIAPGPAITVSTSTNCTAWAQTRPTTAPPDWRNYLECENATNPADNTFATTGPSGSFNDQLVTITASELIPALEGAIAKRIELEIVPALKTVYNATSWGLSGTDKVYPYPATFANPDTSSFTGNSAITAGLLPFAYNESSPGAGVNTCVSSTRCVQNLVSWSNASPSISYTGSPLTFTSACSYAGPTSSATCNGIYTGTPTQITVSGPQSNGAMSLRQVRSGTTGTVWWVDLTAFSISSSSPSPSLRLNSDGTLTVSITVSAPAPLGIAGVFYLISVPGNATTDHTLLDTRTYPTGASTSWFARNEWHKLTYYAVAPGYAANSTVTPRSCGAADPNGACLSVSSTSGSASQRAILILAGRSINQSARPSSTLADYLEFGNAGGNYERYSVTFAPATALTDTGAANAYSVAALTSIASGASFVFKAVNTNSGASTLTTPATGQLSLVNADGSSLSAGTVRASAVIHATYDGTKFLLSKRPFNDRITAIE
jgi:hypothetical protein